MGILGAVAAAMCYGTATIWQAIGIRSFRDAAGPLWRRALAGWLYLAGLVLDGIGYAASFWALRTLPLFLVESATASSVAVTALLAVVILRTRLHQLEVGALLAVLAGLVLLAVAAEPGPATTPSPWLPWALLAAMAALCVATVALRGPVISAVWAGLGYAGTGIASRLLVIPDDLWRVTEDPIFWTLVCASVAALVAYALALDAGRVTTVAGITMGLETVVPSAIGLVLLGDAISPGYSPIALLGFALALAGCLALARHAEVGD